MSNKRGRPRKNAIQTRDPIVDTRDPVTQKPKRAYESRRYISAPMPVICPKCGHNTRQTGGSYKDPVNKKIIEYRECVKCGEKIGAGRDMVGWEIEKYCTHANVVQEYNEVT